MSGTGVTMEISKQSVVKRAIRSEEGRMTVMVLKDGNATGRTPEPSAGTSVLNWNY